MESTKKKYRYDSQSLLSDLNNFRKNPRHLIPKLKQKFDHYNKDKLLFCPQIPRKGIQTIQGGQAIRQLLIEIDQSLQSKIFTENRQLKDCAQDIADWVSKAVQNNQSISQSHSAQKFRKKLSQSKCYVFSNKICCLIGIGFKSQLQPLLTLLIDDGDPFKKNRKFLFNTQSSYCGIGLKFIEKKSFVCAVYLFTDEITSKSQL